MNIQTYSSQGFLFKTRVVDGITHVHVESMEQSPEAEQISLPHFGPQVEQIAHTEITLHVANSDAIATYLTQKLVPSSKKVFFTQNLENFYEFLRKRFPEVMSPSKDTFQVLPFLAFDPLSCSTYINSSKTFRLFHSSQQFKDLISNGIYVLQQKPISENGCEFNIILQYYENTFLKLLEDVMCLIKPFPLAPNAINSISLQVDFHAKVTYMGMIHFLIMVPDFQTVFSKLKEIFYEIPYIFPTSLYQYYSKNEISSMLFIQFLYTIWLYIGQGEHTKTFREALSTAFMDEFLENIFMHYDATFSIFQDNKPYIIHIMEVVLVAVQKESVLMHNRNHSAK